MEPISKEITRIRDAVADIGCMMACGKTCEELTLQIIEKVEKSLNSKNTI